MISSCEIQKTLGYIIKISAIVVSLYLLTRILDHDKNDFGVRQRNNTRITNLTHIPIISYDSNLIEGDILLIEDILPIYNDIKRDTKLIKNGKLRNRGRVLGTTPTRNLWNNVRVGGICWIPVYISKLYTTNTIRKIKNALLDLAIRSGVFYFEFLDERYAYGSPFLDFQETDGQTCSSYVGRISYIRQIINLNEQSCMSTRVIQHEFMHALGFMHEHTRTDRDSYVNVIWRNIQRNRLSDFAIQETDSLGSPYDYTSIMHYPPYSSSNCRGCITLEALDNNTIVFSKKASSGDIIQMRLMYQCATGPRQLWEYNYNRCSIDCKCWEGMWGCKNEDDFCQDGLICENGVICSRPTSDMPSTTNIPSISSSNSTKPTLVPTNIPSSVLSVSTAIPSISTSFLIISPTETPEKKPVLTLNPSSYECIDSVDYILWIGKGNKKTCAEIDATSKYCGWSMVQQKCPKACAYCIGKHPESVSKSPSNSLSKCIDSADFILWIAKGNSKTCTEIDTTSKYCDWPKVQQHCPKKCGFC